MIFCDPLPTPQELQKIQSHQFYQCTCATIKVFLRNNLLKAKTIILPSRASNACILLCSLLQTFSCSIDLDHIASSVLQHMKLDVTSTSTRHLNADTYHMKIECDFLQTTTLNWNADISHMKGWVRLYRLWHWTGMHYHWSLTNVLRWPTYCWQDCRCTEEFGQTKVCNFDWRIIVRGFEQDVFELHMTNFHLSTLLTILQFTNSSLYSASNNRQRLHDTVIRRHYHLEISMNYAHWVKIGDTLKNLLDCSCRLGLRVSPLRQDTV